MLLFELLQSIKKRIYEEKKQHDIEQRYISSGRLKSSYEKNCSFCFFICAIMVTDKEDLQEEKRKAFIIDIKNHPEDSFILDDYPRARHYVYNKGVLNCVSFLPTTKSIDKKCLIDAVKELKAEERIKGKLFYSYILKVMKEGIIGDGYARMTYEEFNTFMKDVEKLNVSNTQNQMPDGTFPNWKIKDKDGNLDLEKTNASIEFANNLILRYNTLYAETYGHPIQIDDQTEI